jgi:hypothetical protein
MPGSTLGGDDPAYGLSPEEVDALEAKLRADARLDRKKNRPGEAAKKNHRATNISRRPSKRANHH